MLRTTGDGYKQRQLVLCDADSAREAFPIPWTLEVKGCFGLWQPFETCSFSGGQVTPIGVGVKPAETLRGDGHSGW